MARLLDITPDDDYHSLPGLSSTTAKTIVAQSPLHAWHQHGAYGAKGKTPTKLMDRGNVIHSLVLGKGKAFRVLDFDSWRTDKSKAARDEARAAKLIPILTEDFEDAAKASVEIMKGLVERGIKLDGISEQAIEWTEDSESGPVVCRGMIDHLRIDAGQELDLKIVGSADPTSVERSAENMGYAIQSAAYQRALIQLRPELAGRTNFLFLFCEPEPPYAMNICEPDGVFAEIGERRWLRAVEIWGRCIKRNEWPGYGAGINRLSAPPWALAREGYSQDGLS